MNIKIVSTVILVCVFSNALLAETNNYLSTRDLERVVEQKEATIQYLRKKIASLEKELAEIKGQPQQAITPAAKDLPMQPVSTEADRTSKDLPLSFICEKTKWDASRKKSCVWGKVINNSEGDYKYVKVIVTAMDSEGRFLTRTHWFCEPHVIGIGEIGYLDEGYIETDQKPDRFIFKVAGEKVSSNRFNDTEKSISQDSFSHRSPKLSFHLEEGTDKVTTATAKLIALSESWGESSASITEMDLALVRSLVKDGADVNAVDHKGYSPLIMATFRGSMETVKILLEAGADPNLECSIGSGSFTPLIMASIECNTDVVRRLMEAGADIHAISYSSIGHPVNPLCVAVLSDCVDVVKVLLEAGADTDAPIEGAVTPLSIATSKEVEELLKEYSD